MTSHSCEWEVIFCKKRKTYAFPAGDKFDLIRFYLTLYSAAILGTLTTEVAVEVFLPAAEE